ncbi:cytochrome b/b6 domain-containing protein [Pedobacter cryoconitis]|uniref:Ni,Fe-hydrogenase I cytochrome b subunit n=1 Tax=Pedobacter cryoconitis TaxID=188932 RepID=A0A7X0J7N7_9SPHI|nr:cytochrome b/b6 domain-containing protein [Pedobacter cryoconitis]MBB6501191.1 Ni,Fe-hydrogenase I cytochrome b subunit [Pedobacter cryoconitis]
MAITQKKYAAGIRLWHWTNMLIIGGSLLTVLLNSTLLDKHSNTDFIQQQLQSSGATLSATQAKGLANAFEDRVWDIHIYFGYFLAALLLYRFILEFFQPADQKFTNKLKLAYAYYFSSPDDEKKITRHNFLVKLAYTFFYVLLTIIVITGLSLSFGDNLRLASSISHNIKSVHGFCMYLMLAFILVHIAGVFLAERKDSKGIVSDMINGGNQ